MMDDTNLATQMTANDEPEVLHELAQVSAREGLDPLARRLLELQGWLHDDLTDLEGFIDAFDRDLLAADAQSPQGGILGRQAARHLLEQRGKRIRPLCVLLAARMGGRKLDTTVRGLAVAAEFVHAATLLHDDVIDEGTERRGAPASRMLFGNSASILGGDHLLIEALRLVERTKHHALLAGLLDIIAQMVAAEALQLEQRGRFRPSRELVLRIIDGKTAALFRWGLAAGGTVAELDERAILALSRAGNALGTAFQLIDDVLDIEGDPTLTGKDPVADLREGKLTWPVTIACERDAGLLGELTRFANARGELEPEETASLLERIRSSGAAEATRDHAAEQAELALRELAHLPTSRARRAMEHVVEAAVHRLR